MSADKELDIISEAARRLTDVMPLEEEMQLRGHYELPNVEVLRQLLDHVKGAIFPQFFGHGIYVDTSRIFTLCWNRPAMGWHRHAA